jgi:hypothetical protein
MARGTDSEKRGRTRKRTINWVAGLSTVAALLSGCAAMVTAANGVWHPPVPIPVLKAEITWVGATPTLASAATTAPTTAETATPAPVASAAIPPPPTPPDGPSTVADLGKGVTMWIASLYPGTSIHLAIANHGTDPFVLDVEPSDVTVYDDQSPTHVYGIRTSFGAPVMSGNHQVIQPSSTPCNDCVQFTVDGNPSPLAKHWTVTLKAISGRTNVSVVYTLA